MVYKKTENSKKNFVNILFKKVPEMKTDTVINNGKPDKK